MNDKIKYIFIIFIIVFFIINIFNFATIYRYNTLVNGSYFKSFLSDIIDVNNTRRISIEVDINPVSSHRNAGPIAFIKGINEFLPYSNKYCEFIPSKNISIESTKNEVDYFYMSLPRLNEKQLDEWINTNNSNRLLLGPNFVPSNWFKFPQQNYWKEKNFPKYLEKVKAMVVHSDRVRNHLAEKSNSTSLLHKFINMRACTNLKPNNKIKSFKERPIDILYYEKYADLDHSKQGEELYGLLNKTDKNIVKMNYGGYDKKKMIEWANDSKFIIYFSFFDTGAIGLKEIQNHGVYAFTIQADLVNDNSTIFYIPELAEEDGIKTAFKKIMEKIEMITKENPDTELVVKKNYDSNNCQMALDDLCKGIVNS